MTGSKREAVRPSFSFLLNSSPLIFYPSILLPLDLRCRAGINTLCSHIHATVPQQMRKSERFSKGAVLNVTIDVHNAIQICFHQSFQKIKRFLLWPNS